MKKPNTGEANIMVSSAENVREFYRRQGEQREQERIIKLLEEWGENAICFCCASDAAASEIVELIKGENNGSR